jgi:hypothetical protein
MNYEKEKEKYISFCGSYCRLCDWFTGRFRMIYEEGLDALRIYKFNKALDDKVDIDNFRRGLEILARSNICPGCKAEAGEDPDRCEIRACAYNKGFQFCIECGDYPCEILSENPGVKKFGCLENFEDILAKGFKWWIDREWERYVRNNTGEF